LFNERFNNPKIIVKGPENMSTDALKDELKGAMRSIHRLGPVEEDDFALNAISDFSKTVSSLFGSINLGGWMIGLLSLIVGAFGIANIMFVTVRERTPIIGLKKAIGAKKRTILIEFLFGKCPDLHHWRTDRHCIGHCHVSNPEQCFQFPHLRLSKHPSSCNCDMREHWGVGRHHTSHDCC